VHLFCRSTVERNQTLTKNTQLGIFRCFTHCPLRWPGPQIKSWHPELLYRQILASPMLSSHQTHLAFILTTLLSSLADQFYLEIMYHLPFWMLCSQASILARSRSSTYSTSLLNPLIRCISMAWQVGLPIDSHYLFRPS
jgi:hypothetical protein